MRLIHSYLVIVNISGYTNSITQRTVSLLHAEQIISTLMETVIDQAEHPLKVNKLEGDATLPIANTSKAIPKWARMSSNKSKHFFRRFMPASHSNAKVAPTAVAKPAQH